jgi:hypothetical protein
MKNLRVVMALIPMAAFAMFIYFSTSGFFSANEKESSVSKPNGNTVILLATITGGDDCKGTEYKVCINGGAVFTVYSNSFNVELPCDAYSEVCVLSNTGCCGRWQGTLPGCDELTFFGIEIPLSTETICCECLL